MTACTVAGKIVAHSPASAMPCIIYCSIELYSKQKWECRPMPDLRLPSQPQGITAPWPVPNYTVWWQRNMCVNNLPKVVTYKRNGRESNPRPFESHVQHTSHYAIRPHCTVALLSQCIKCMALMFALSHDRWPLSSTTQQAREFKKN